MNTQQAYIKGFVKRASQYGFNQHEAVLLLKRANVVQGAGNAPKHNDMWQNTVSAPKVNIAPKQNTMTQPSIAPTPSMMPSRSSVMSQPPQTPESITQNREVANIPLSGMTPKNEWESKLHNIMAKKPVFNIGSNKYNFRSGIQPDGTINQLVAPPAPHPIQMAYDHTNNLVTALKGDGERVEDLTHSFLWPENGASPHSAILNKGVKANDPRVIKIDHINEIRDHLKKYDPAWGSDFRVPVEKHDMPGEESDLNDVWQNYATRRDEFKKLFADHINNMNNPTANLTANPL